MRLLENKKRKGLKFIDAMNQYRDCYFFTASKTAMACKCCSHFAVPINVAKMALIRVVEEFWRIDRLNENITRSTVAEVEGMRLATFLLPYFDKLSPPNRPRYKFVVAAGADGSATKISLCLPSTVKCFGLPSGSFRVILRESEQPPKILNVSLLQFISENYTNANEMDNYYKRFRASFPQSLVPITESNPVAVRLIHSILNGKIVHLNAEEKESVNYFLLNHCPDPSQLPQIGEGGDNIRFGHPQNMSRWDGLKESAGTQALHNCLVNAVSQLWNHSMEARLFFRYRINCLFSQVTTDNPTCLPQDPHTDFNVDMVNDTYKQMLLKLMIAFCPLHQDGCIIMIWIDDYKPFQGDRRDIPGEFYLYIPFGVLLMLPGDIMHAGGFCFSGDGHSIGLPEHLKDFTNHRLHFFLCPNVKSYNEVYAEDQEEEEAAKQTAKGSKKATMAEIPRPPIDPKYKLVLPKFEKLSKAILTTVTSDDDDDDDNDDDDGDDDNDMTTSISDESDKKPAAKKRKA